MSYCRFENTYADLQECYESMDDDLSKTEHEYRQLMVKLCQDIINDFEHLIDEKYVEEQED